MVAGTLSVHLKCYVCSWDVVCLHSSWSVTLIAGMLLVYFGC